MMFDASTQAALSAVDLADFVQRDGIPLRRIGRCWQGRCPFHDDDSPSFTIYPSGKGWYCFGCSVGGSALDYVIDRAGGDRQNSADIARGLALLGIGDGPRLPLPALPPRAKVTTATSARPAPPARPPDAIYPYTDPGGVELYQVWRWDLTEAERTKYGGATKLIRHYHPDGRPGMPKGVAHTLYNLPAVLAADPSEPVYVCEGEKKAQRLIDAGLTATCNSGGAGKWPDACSHYLAGRKVIILPDNDEIGERHAEMVAASVRPFAAEVKVIRLPGLEPKGDVFDWLELHTVDALKVLADFAPALPAVDPDTGEIATQASEDVALLYAELERIRCERDDALVYKALLFSRSSLELSDRLALVVLQVLIDEGLLTVGAETELEQKDVAARLNLSKATVGRMLDNLQGMGIARHRTVKLEALVDRQGNELRNPKSGKVKRRQTTYIACDAAPREVSIATLQSPVGRNGKNHGGKRPCPVCGAPGSEQEVVNCRKCRKCGKFYLSDGTILLSDLQFQDETVNTSSTNMKSQERPTPPPALPGESAAARNGRVASRDALERRRQERRQLDETEHTQAASQFQDETTKRASSRYCEPPADKPAPDDRPCQCGDAYCAWLWLRSGGWVRACVDRRYLAGKAQAAGDVTRELQSRAP